MKPLEMKLKKHNKIQASFLKTMKQNSIQFLMNQFLHFDET